MLVLWCRALSSNWCAICHFASTYVNWEGGFIIICNINVIIVAMSEQNYLYIFISVPKDKNKLRFVIKRVVANRWLKQKLSRLREKTRSILLIKSWILLFKPSSRNVWAESRDVRGGSGGCWATRVEACRNVCWGCSAPDVLPRLMLKFGFSFLCLRILLCAFSFIWRTALYVLLLCHEDVQ